MTTSKLMFTTKERESDAMRLYERGHSASAPTRSATTSTCARKKQC